MTRRAWLDGVSAALGIPPPRRRDLRPLRLSGGTRAPTPAGDYRPSLRSPWPAAEVVPLRPMFVLEKSKGLGCLKNDDPDAIGRRLGQAPVMGPKLSTAGADGGGQVQCVGCFQGVKCAQFRGKIKGGRIQGRAIAIR